MLTWSAKGMPAFDTKRVSQLRRETRPRIDEECRLFTSHGDDSPVTVTIHQSR
jgi:hypothetical protein